MSALLPPARMPCPACPYRMDTPSGVWAPQEYDKLRAYDAPTGDQPAAMFQCHQVGADDSRARVCAGWAGCHNGNPRGHELLAYRLNGLIKVMSPEDLEATADYVSPVPLFASAHEAAEHGMAEIDRPSAAAVEAMAKIYRVRPDVRARADWADDADDNLVFDDEDGGS